MGGQSNNTQRHRQERINEIQDVFTAADLNKDGLLDQNELKNFFIAMHSKRITRGLPSDDPANRSDHFWENVFVKMN